MRQQLVGLLYGWVVILGLVLITSFILAFVLRFSSLNEPALSWVTLIVGLITLFIGGITAGVKGKAKGWLIGTITGLGFTLFTFLLQYLGYHHGFTLEQALQHLGYIFASLIGGVIGVNVISGNQDAKA
ncbi:TIGR04086 family membrane protein [Virgibacillus sp. 179-BFC.A HS]|uniref:TIGR04086 family membrane protein n=1 Tax=Tigheibacillus jepli TaxID=3035914 RepID=A0ABU5CIX2_9BACI|nr:TIGR04086 family membrane protein [Virgibacillus sp. 179-BFC.A HS]MDY0405473.1 TIGR04086 family membrane protein [Virgibacillus sp. 179-BFC.A HS]